MIILRGRARRLVARSWTLSWFYYRLHGVPLAGWPGEPIWYFAYGANMHDRAFRDGAACGQSSSASGASAATGCASISSRPRGRSAPAICARMPGGVGACSTKVTRRDLLRLDSTEGVPGRGYRQQWFMAEDNEGRPVSAVAYIARGTETDGNPSLRYLTLLREGARANGLPGHWLQFLDSVGHADVTAQEEH
jgi:hypothetical protein